MKKNRIKGLISKIHVRFQISLICLIFIILTITTASTLTAVLSINRTVSKQKAEQLFREAGFSIQLKLDSQIDKAIQLAALMTTIPDFTQSIEGFGDTHSGNPFKIEALNRNSYLYSIYTGFSNGDFHQIIKTSGNPLIIEVHDAPAATEYILRAINGTGLERTEHWSFLDKNLDLLSSSINPTPTYFPKERPWFHSAVSTADVILTEPYIYDSLEQPGITAAAAISETSVAGIDITLEDLSSFLNSINISPNTGIMVIDSFDRILALNIKMEEQLNKGIHSIREINSPRSDRFLLSTPWDAPGGQNFQLIISAPASDFLGHQQIIQRRILIISTVIFILILPLIIITAIYFSRFLEHLAADAERIQHFNFDGEIAEHSPIIEFEELAEAYRIMKKAIAAKTQALQTALQKLERIIELGIAMSVEEDSDKLIEMILTGAKELSHADGGSLYLKGEEDELEFQIVLNDSLGFAQGGTSSNPITMPPVQLYMTDGTPNFHNVVSSSYHNAETIVIDDAYKDPHYDFSGTKKFDKLNDYRSKSFLTVPLKLQGSDIIGALQLINCYSDEVNDVVPFSESIQSFIEALSALAAAILYNRSLLDSQDALFESLIHLTASAIDTKSPYTGGHCERVPVLAQKLAEKAENTTEGPLKHFRFNTPIEKKAFVIGSWLHDAGKMTTPEFIVDKAVKLETINNRIHEIRTRFEVLLRDARLIEKEALLEGRDPAEAAAELEAAEKKLFEDFEFIAQGNTGEITVNKEYLNKLEELSRITWKSNFDHTIGLTREEKEQTAAPFVKGETIDEPLLADKPMHIIPDKGKTRTKYENYGFILPHPNYLYNRGEIHNLKIKSGTLTEEERYKINEHIMQTIVMLDQLPFPKGMTKIPEFVGTHHETLTGSGYPRGLESKQLSIPSRIMAIADIFEALTASDRPYKEAKTLSEAVTILYKLTTTKQIDADIFEMFLTSGIYLEYAKAFLPQKQIDEVDINKYIRKD